VVHVAPTQHLYDEREAMVNCLWRNALCRIRLRQGVKQIDYGMVVALFLPLANCSRRSSRHSQLPMSNHLDLLRAVPQVSETLSLPHFLAILFALSLPVGIIVRIDRSVRRK
jgi:hypothetical protein